MGEVFRQKDLKTRHVWETIIQLGRLKWEWLGCPRRGQRPAGKADWGQVTGSAALEGELYPLAWRSLTLKCHWKRKAS